MAGAPSFVYFEISEEAIMEDYYGSSNINFHFLAHSGGAFLDLEVNGFYISSRSSASLIYHVRVQSILREDPAQTNSLFFPSVDATEVESNTLVWNVQGLQIGNSSSILLFPFGGYLGVQVTMDQRGYMCFVGEKYCNGLPNV
ncbi:uncharacterized protein G2W53_018800 [Senna tora]|uniref:Uncharacterized protein n=1 Tax=Senna tora TaxID=362788 RepID=A0A834TW15_9FABA|nr:uncharacterized protein G2W53_018800 [Senna tora]